TGVIPASIGQLPGLTNLGLGINKFSGSIPSGLSSLASSDILNSLSFESNNFVFSDFEANFTIYKSNLTTFTYLTQDKVDQTETLSVAANGSITLSSAALTSTNNSYQWYKGGVAITGATNKDLIISNATDADAGVYHFTATNSVITDLTLTRNPITLSIGAGDTCGVSAAERQALVDLYNSTDGANWTNTTGNNKPWLINDPTSKVCDWYGITVANGEVRGLSLPENNLTGTLPNSLGSLLELRTIYLHSNNLSGNIPSSFGNLSFIRFLFLHSNNLEGNIPSELGMLSNLIDLLLFSNQLTGVIPPELGNLSKLRDLNLSRNKLSGSIPSEFGQFSSTLFRINISYNYNLKGKIPSSISNLAGLTIFRMNTNKFVFSDIEADFNSYINKLNTFQVAPQAKVDQTETLSVETNGSITLSSIALTSTNNSYQWYKDGVAITGATNKDLVISNATEADAGVYHFTATNSIVTGLTLTRNPITLEITQAVNELEVTINTKDLPNSEFDIVSGSTTIPGIISGNPDSETLVNLGANTGEDKTVLINVKPSQNTGALHLRFIANTSGISNVQVSNGGNWLDFSPEFYRIEGSTLYFMNKKTTPVVPFTINLINGVQYDSSVPLTINVNNNIDLTGATVEIFSPSNTNIVVQPSASINGFVLGTTLTESGSYKFIIKIQNKSFKGHFLVAGSGQTGNSSF
ncbi:immunoglobulin domain-containing protein, partial [Aquimarina sp. Aq78]|uniref:immunoglobulin domain-containing protein n=2 Tax=Aquimarina sp. Aq78 TaxID=1191889 RepID=UPI000D0E63CF